MGARSTPTLEGFVVEMRGEFATKDLGDVNYYIGCYIPRSREEGTIKSISMLTSRLWRDGMRLRRQVLSPLRLVGCVCRRRMTPRLRRRWRKYEVFDIEKQWVHVMGTYVG